LSKRVHARLFDYNDGKTKLLSMSGKQYDELVNGPKIKCGWQKTIVSVLERHLLGSNER
jgi:hypothetical protein